MKVQLTKRNFEKLLGILQWQRHNSRWLKGDEKLIEKIEHLAKSPHKVKYE